MLNFDGKIITFLICLPSFLFSTTNDSLKHSKNSPITQYFYQNQFEYNDSVNVIENTLFNFQNYFDRNHLGNSGLPFNSFHYTLFPSEFGFNYSLNNYRNYFYHPGNIKFYNTRSPFSDLLYIIGSKVEQNFKMTFSYNVKKNWNISTEFCRIRSEGTYTRQQTYDNFIAISSNFKSENNRYFLLASVNYNNAKNDENGGISSDVVFEKGGSIDRKTISTNLPSAKRTTVNRTFFLKQYFNFGANSGDTSLPNSIIPSSRLIFTTKFDDNILKYEDDYPLVGFYSTIYYDSTKTFDSTYTSCFENELKWKKVDNGKRSDFKNMIGLGFGIKEQFVKVYQREIDTLYNNIIASVDFYNTYSNHKFWWNISGKYALAGYNVKDYDFYLESRKNIGDSLISLFFKAEIKQQIADFIFYRFSSNNFKWKNNFEKIQKKSLALNFSMIKYKFSAGADLSEYSQVLYFDNYAIARQYKGSIPVLSVFLKKDFKFRNFHLTNKVIYQNVSDSTVIRLPELFLEHSLYFEKDLLKGAMRLQIGASVYYNTAYYSNAYMPATGQFYVQDQNKYGNYPIIDFFINARIKTVRIFLKIDHLNSGWVGNRYMLTPHYPLNDRAFKLGLSWRFFD